MWPTIRAGNVFVDTSGSRDRTLELNATYKKSTVAGRQSATWARIDVRGADGKRALPGIYLN